MNIQFTTPVWLTKILFKVLDLKILDAVVSRGNYYLFGFGICFEDGDPTTPTQWEIIRK